MAKTQPGCTCDCTPTSFAGRGSGRRAIVAGALGGAAAVVVIGVLVAAAFRRMGPRMMPRMMGRMMRDCEGSPEMRACMEKCGCVQRSEEPPES
jgi:hypothetical protein